MAILHKFKTKKIITWLNILFFSFHANLTLAISKDPYQRLEQSSGAAGYNVFSKPSFQTILLTITRYLLGLVGLIFIFLIIYAGYQWMTSAGNEEKIAKAKSTLLNAALGLLIIFVSYAITLLVTEVLIKSTTPGYYSYPSYSP